MHVHRHGQRRRDRPDLVLRDITLADAQPPTLTVPSDQVAEATGSGGAAVTLFGDRDRQRRSVAGHQLQPRLREHVPDHDDDSHAVLQPTRVATRRHLAPFDVTVRDTTRAEYSRCRRTSCSRPRARRRDVHLLRERNGHRRRQHRRQLQPSSGSVFPVGPRRPSTALRPTATATAPPARSRSRSHWSITSRRRSRAFRRRFSARRMGRSARPSPTRRRPPTTTSTPAPLLVTCSPASGATFPLGVTAVQLHRDGQPSQHRRRDFLRRRCRHDATHPHSAGRPERLCDYAGGHPARRPGCELVPQRRGRHRHRRHDARDRQRRSRIPAGRTDDSDLQHDGRLRQHARAEPRPSRSSRCPRPVRRRRPAAAARPHPTGRRQEPQGDGRLAQGHA